LIFHLDSNKQHFVSASPLTVVIYPPPHQTRSPILIIVEMNTTALDITNKVAILFCMSPTCVDAHYLYFDTRNKHTPASTLQEIGVRDYGVIRLLMPLLGRVVTTHERTSPLSTSPTCEQTQAHLLLRPANCSCNNSFLHLAEKSWVVKDKVLEFERVNAIESDTQKFEFYVSGSNPENQCHLHVISCEDEKLALSMEITSSL